MRARILALAVAAAVGLTGRAGAADVEKAQEAFAAAKTPDDFKKVVALADKAIKDNADAEPGLAILKLTALTKAGDPAKATAYLDRLGDVVFPNDPNQLNLVVWTVVEDPGEKADKKLMQAAVRVALKADKLADEADPYLADTVAKAFYEAGDVVKALQHQKRAVRLAKGTPLENDPGVQERLQLYIKKGGNKA